MTKPTTPPVAAQPASKPTRRLLVGGLAGVGAVSVLATMIVWYLISPEPPAPAERFQSALDMIKAGQHEQPREIADQLREEEFVPEDFAGGLDYVLGMCQFLAATTPPPVEPKEEEAHGDGHEAHVEAGGHGDSHGHAEPKPAAHGGHGAHGHAAEPAAEPEPVQTPEEIARARFSAAISFLRAADEAGMNDAYADDFTYALGTSLYETGERMASLPLLAATVESQHPRRLDAGARLAELYLDPSLRTAERLKKVLDLNQARLDAATEAERTVILRQRFDLLLALGDFDAASAIIDELEHQADQAQNCVLFRGRLLLAKKDFIGAMALMEPVAADEAVDQDAPRQACYLMARAAEQQVLKFREELEIPAKKATATAGQDEYRQRAAEYYRRAATRFPKTDEAFAALVRLGKLQQQDGAYEKAIQSFGTVLRSITDPKIFLNRWLTLDQVQQEILEAWNIWIQSERFAEAIALADLMTPAFPSDQAYELAAVAHQRWAEQATLAWQKETAKGRAALDNEQSRRWRESAQAFARLARARRGAPNYAETLWQATDHAHRGKDFPMALSLVDLFLEQTSETMRPSALVRRGEILLDLDKLDEAEECLKSVRREYPTSPAAFTASYKLAVCRLEKNDLDGADAGWRAIIASPELSPAAREWRESLIALAELQRERASWARRKLELPNLKPEEGTSLWTEVSRRSRESIELLEQYLTRYADSPELANAQYNLGKALQLEGDVWRNQWDKAETENARQQAQAQLEKVLTRALQQFLNVRNALAEADRADQLTVVQRQLLENAWFEYPSTLFSLGRYQDAVTAYAAFVHHYPQDVRVLTAYVQMAEAYKQLDRPVEARSMLEQAKVMLDQDQIPAAAFKVPTTTLSRVEWEEWLNRARQVHPE